MAYVRAEAEKALPDTCDIWARQISSDGQGGYSEAWALTYKGIACRLAERSGKETFLAGRETVEGNWVLTVAYDQSVDEQMRIEYQAHTYEVKFVNDDRSHDTVRRCLLLRLS